VRRLAAVEGGCSEEIMETETGINVLLRTDEWGDVYCDISAVTPVAEAVREELNVPSVWGICVTLGGDDVSEFTLGELEAEEDVTLVVSCTSVGTSVEDWEAVAREIRDMNEVQGPEECIMFATFVLKGDEKEARQEFQWDSSGLTRGLRQEEAAQMGLCRMDVQPTINIPPEAQLDTCYIKCTRLPESIGQLITQGHMTIKGVSELPNGVESLVVCGDLYLDQCFLRYLPSTIGGMEIGGCLHLGANNVSDLDSVQSGGLQGGNRLTSLPDSIVDIRFGGGGMMARSALVLCNNRLTSLPEAFGDLRIKGPIDLRDNQLKVLPDSIRNIRCDLLELQNNPLASLPTPFRNITTGVITSQGYAWRATPADGAVHPTETSEPSSPDTTSNPNMTSVNGRSPIVVPVVPENRLRDRLCCAQ